MVRELQAGMLRIEHNGQVIAQHQVLAGQHQVSHNHDHTKGIPRSDGTRVNGKVAGVQVATQVEQRDLEVYEQISAAGVMS